MNVRGEVETRTPLTANSKLLEKTPVNQIQVSSNWGKKLQNSSTYPSCGISCLLNQLYQTIKFTCKEEWVNNVNTLSIYAANLPKYTTGKKHVQSSGTWGTCTEVPDWLQWSSDRNYDTYDLVRQIRQRRGGMFTMMLLGYVHTTSLSALFRFTAQIRLFCMAVYISFFFNVAQQILQVRGMRWLPGRWEWLQEGAEKSEGIWWKDGNWKMAWGLKNMTGEEGQGDGPWQPLQSLK